MPRRAARAAVLGVLTAALVADGGEAAPADPDVVTYDRFLPGTEPPGTCATLVVHGRTGRGLAGARLRGHAPAAPPASVPGPPGLLATTDGFGIANAPLSGPGFEWIVDHYAFAPCRADGLPPPRVALVPGTVLAGRVLEPDGSPWRGGVVEAVGAPHRRVPLARAPTDGDGRFELSGVDLDPRHGVRSLRFPGLRLEEDDVPDVAAFAGAGAVVVARASIAVLGAVRDARYRPVAGAVVLGPRATERAVTDDFGRFRVTGVRRHDPLRFFHASWRGGAEPFHVAAGAEADRPVLVTLPGEGPAAGSARGRVRVVLTAGGVEGADLVRGLALRIVSRDGEVRDGVTSDDPSQGPPGSAEFAVAWTGMAVIVGSPFGRVWHRGFCRVPRDAPDRVTLDVPDTQARLALDLHAVPEGARAWLACEGEERPVPLPDPGLVHVPSEGLVSLRVDGPDGWTEAVRLLPVLDGARLARVRWPAPRRFRVPPGPDLATLLPPPGVVFDVERSPEGLLLRTQAEGELVWRVDVRPHAGTAPVAPTVLRATRGSGREPEPPTLEQELLPLRSLRVLEADGRPARDAALRGVRDEDLGAVGPGPDGLHTWASTRPSARVYAHAPGRVDLPVETRARGRNEVRWGPVDLVLDVRADGRPVTRFVVAHAGRLYDGRDGAPALRGLDPGFHVLLVGAPGCRTVRVHARAPASGTWRLPLVLPRLE